MKIISKKRIAFTYEIMLLVFLGIVLAAILGYEGPTLSDAFFGEPIDYEEGWVDSEGTEVDVTLIQKIPQTVPYESYSAYNTLPSELHEGDALCFRSKNIFFQIYVDGALVYDPYVQESILYTKSYGTSWNYVPLLTQYAGKTIELRYYRVYESARASIDNLYIGKPAGVILTTFEGKLVAFITSLLLIFVGLLLIILDIPINVGSQKNHELKYLGFFALSIAIWCLSETHLIQFFIGDTRAMQLLSCGSLMLIPIPMVLYLDAAFGLRRKWLVGFIGVISILHNVICWGLHLTGIADIHETLTVAHGMLIFCALILLIVVLRNTFSNKSSSSIGIFRILRGIGLASISIATVIDVIRYYTGNGNDSAMFVRIGLLLFILCFGGSSLEKTINAVKLGIRTEFVSQLAYKDGLTRIGNRTAFEERLAELKTGRSDLEKVGIVMFDVNDLKYVNDHFGHHVGDEMLVRTSEMIQAAFQAQGGDCYRIGGDEFAVLFHGEQPEGCIHDSITLFEQDIDAFNQQPEKTFRISVAYGFAICDAPTPEDITETYEKADKLMYENKKDMKSRQIPPEEYYKKR